MKKNLILSLCLFLFLFSPLSVNANPPINTGYTSEGISYNVYELKTTFSDTIVLTAGQTIEVIREFQFATMLVPPSKKVYTELYKGVTYTGTLTLSNFYYENGNTIAIYIGTLTAVN